MARHKTFRPTVVTVTDAQWSALECAGLFDGFDDATDGERAIVAAIAGRRLTVTDDTRDALFSAVNDLSNSEDENSQHVNDPELRRLTARASRSLGALASRILRA